MLFSAGSGTAAGTSSPIIAWTVAKYSNTFRKARSLVWHTSAVTDLLDVQCPPSSLAPKPQDGASSAPGSRASSRSGSRAGSRSGSRSGSRASSRKGSRAGLVAAANEKLGEELEQKGGGGGGGGDDGEQKAGGGAVVRIVDTKSLVAAARDDRDVAQDYLVSASRDGTVCFWNLRTNATERILVAHEPVAVPRNTT